ncbi:hypothetical protein [Roseateles albus]|uniref:Uncharacterized protein n=1 Tax=Roseateles albus TaxID=2987525 RepID=A0ABT5KE36_9BURK|nr:hypothetical protein [Roseateles albus]MDC8771719.1 hypothetical protein [Roseateles albus]
MNVSTIGEKTTAPKTLPNVTSLEGAEWAAAFSPAASAIKVANAMTIAEGMSAKGTRHRQYFQSDIFGWSRNPSKLRITV